MHRITPGSHTLALSFKKKIKITCSEYGTLPFIEIGFQGNTTSMCIILWGKNLKINLRWSAVPQKAPYSCSSLSVQVWAPSLVVPLCLGGHQMGQSSLCQRQKLLARREQPWERIRNNGHLRTLNRTMWQMHLCQEKKEIKHWDAYGFFLDSHRTQGNFTSTKLLRVHFD